MMRALRSAGAAQLRSAPSSGPPPDGKPSRYSRASVPRRRSSVAVPAKTSDDEELQRRPPGHPLAFGGPTTSSSPSPSGSAEAPLSWPSLDLASVAAALARSEEASSGGGNGRRGKKKSRLPGGVHLVGTGPGDAGLLTLRAVALLASADVVLYDRLVSPEILALVNPAARMVYVGKSKGLHTRSQEEIHDLLVAFASPPPDSDGDDQDEGKGGNGDGETTKKHPIVLRLKGGDPLVFGRGGEEATALREAGIPVHTVPGISAAGGVAASLGIPLTHRGVATSVRLMTGHARPGGELGLEEDIERVAASPDREHTTLVIYMGLSTLPETSRRLVRCGMLAGTPAVAVERGTTSRQRAIYATVEDLPGAVAEARLVSPTLIIIGGVVALSPGWQEAFGGGEDSKGENEDDGDDEDNAAASGVSSAAVAAADLAAAA